MAGEDDVRRPPRTTRTQPPDRTKGPTATLRRVESKEDLMKTKKAEAAANKELKETKKIHKENEKAIKDIVEKFADQNRQTNEENMDKVNDKIEALGTTIATALKNEVKESLTDIAIVDAMADKDTRTTTAENQSQDNLSTQRIINDITAMNRRMNTIEDRSQDKTNQSRTTQPQPHRKPPPKKVSHVKPSDMPETILNTINKIIDRINTLQTTLEHPDQPTLPPGQPTPKPRTNPKKYTPAANISSEGGEDDQTVQRTTDQPLDYTMVKRPRRHNRPRPELNSSAEDKVKQDLGDHIRKQAQDKIKRKPQKDMDDRTRTQTIEDMLAQSQLTVGVAPISGQKVERVMEKMIQRGVIDRKEPYKNRVQRTIKSMIKGWAHTHMGMPDKDWNDIEVEEITMTYTEGADIAFIIFVSQEDVSKFTSKSRNLPHDATGSGPRIIMHVDKRAMARYRAHQQIAKSIREKSNNEKQTNIRTGCRDFLLRV